jgi:hypothetical protein
MELQVPDRYYEHIPERVINVIGMLLCGAYRLLQIKQYWQTNLIQCCTIKKEKSHLLIDISVPDDSNVNTKETQKLSKYKDLENKVSRIWQVRTSIVPVIIAALGTIKNGLD